MENLIQEVDAYAELLENDDLISEDYAELQAASYEKLKKDYKKFSILYNLHANVPESELMTYLDLKISQFQLRALNVRCRELEALVKQAKKNNKDAKNSDTEQ
jgi:hypothetical protein